MFALHCFGLSWWMTEFRGVSWWVQLSHSGLILISGRHGSCRSWLSCHYFHLNEQKQKQRVTLHCSCSDVGSRPGQQKRMSSDPYSLTIYAGYSECWTCNSSSMLLFHRRFSPIFGPARCGRNRPKNVFILFTCSKRHETIKTSQLQMPSISFHHVLVFQQVLES